MLVDPWLVGELTFLDAAWLYRGRKRALPTPVDLGAVCDRTDVIILSQALPDHAHAPTLAALPDKSIPVLCSPSAEGAARAAGFTDVTPLAHGQSAAAAGGRLRVTATAGALVGPPWATRENGFVIEQAFGGGEGRGRLFVAGGSGWSQTLLKLHGSVLTLPPTRPHPPLPQHSTLQLGDVPVRLYYEPHCDAGPGALEAAGRVDVVVAPAVSQKIAGFPLVSDWVHVRLKECGACWRWVSGSPHAATPPPPAPSQLSTSGHG